MFRWLGRRGWPVTIWFESKEAAQEAAATIGPIIAEYNLSALDPRPDIVRAFGKPSLALEVGLTETKIPRNRRTAWDR